jgi:NAD(P)-dependent dehydrogenase (short-subunit alcohol dehydrogenase family)
MAERAAIVTGASRGIGRAIAEMLAQEGYGLTITARKPDGVEAAADALRSSGAQVEALAANLAQAEAVEQVVAAHRERFGRLDVLVNNAGVGIGAAADGHELKFIDMQLAVNLRTPILFYRHALDLLKAAGAEHRSALVVNLASIAGVSPQPWLSVYSATKAALIAYTKAMNKELAGEGIKSVALCPGFVDTDMTDFVKGEVPAQEMIRPEDIAAAVRFALSVSPACVIPQIIFERPGETV